MTSLNPVIVHEIQLKKMYVVTHSPTNQCRNKDIFWYCEQLSPDYEIEIIWIYLECRHGKGVPDGSGANIKKKENEIGELPSYEERRQKNTKTKKIVQDSNLGSDFF